MHVERKKDSQEDLGFDKRTTQLAVDLEQGGLSPVCVWPQFSDKNQADIVTRQYSDSKSINSELFTSLFLEFLIKICEHVSNKMRY